MPTLTRLSIPERLAALAGLAAAAAAVAGFIPGLYRDPPVIVSQSHGYDLGILVGVLVLWLGLLASTRGSVRGRLVATGALGALLYSFVTYAFMIVLNSATILYIAVLGFGGWAFATGLATIDEHEVDAAVADRLPRRAAGVFLAVLAVFFAITWLSQIAGAVVSGRLPVELQEAGWPMNPVFVLDLAFVLPLMALTSLQLVRHARGGARLAIPLLVFMPLLGLSILAMSLWAAADGQTLEPVVPAIFLVVIVLSTALAWLTLGRSRRAGTDRFAHAA